MSLFVFDVDDPGITGRFVVTTCIDHPRYEGSRQSKAYLEGCLGCRAVYAIYQTRKHKKPGRNVPTLRVEVSG